MYVLRRRTRIEIWTPAKVNLFLEVLGRRNDGFHEIETLMTPVSLFDTLRFSAAEEGRIELRCRWAGPAGRRGELGGLPPAEQNLVYRAVDLLRRRSGETRGLRVSLIKRIPSASGMGGGSSDAAAALVGANLLWGLNWTRQQLAPLAAELGSDVPFFLSDSTAVCRGRGERVEPVAGGPPQHYVVVRPHEGLSTATVYRQTQVAECPERVDDLLGDLKAGRIGELSHRLFNRLQPAALHTAPCLEELQREFAHVDVRGHQLSGSGSGYFGVCRHAKHARRVAGVLRARCRGHIFCVTSVGAVSRVRRRTSQN